MAIESVIQFLEATSTDAALQKDLAGILGVGDGDISSAVALDESEERALLGERGLLVTVFADQRGYPFTVAELNAVVGVLQRYKAGELSDTELAGVLGLKGQDAGLQSLIKTADKAVGMVYRGIRHEPTAAEATGRVPQVLQFMQRTAEDAELRESLKSILGTGDGDISDFANLEPDEEEALKTARGALVAEFAAKHGFSFTMADLFAVVDAFQKVQAGEMSEDTFMRYLNLTGASADYFPFIERVREMTYKGFRYATAVPVANQGNSLEVVRFMEATKDNEALRKELQAIIGGGDGDISAPEELDATEAQSLTGEKAEQIVKLGAGHGYHFTPTDLAAVTGAFQLVESGKLPLESCMRILGLKSAGGDKQPDLANVSKTAGRIYRGVRI